MVQINFTRENSNCDISNKNILRRSLENMGNQEGHHMHPSSKLHGANEKKVSSSGNLRYNVEDLMALRDSPLSNIKPVCVDERSFWIGGKPYVNRKKTDREKRIGSGRINNNSEQNQHLSTFHYPNPYREKTGREFCERRSTNAQPCKDWNVNYFNPVNSDHRRLMDERNDESEPEWVQGGPTSRFDTIDLHGFQDDCIEDVQHYTQNYRPQGRSTPSKTVNVSGQAEDKENRDKYNKTFSFDEFLGSDGPIERFLADSGQPAVHYPQGSRFKRYFKQRNYEKGYYQQSHPPSFDQHKTGGSNSAVTLLDLLHGQGHNVVPRDLTHRKTYKNLSQMPSANELEMLWRQSSNPMEQNGDYQKLMQQMDYNKNFLAGKSVVEVLGVLAQTQLRQQQPLHQMTGLQNQYMGIHGRPILKNYQVNQMQMARVLERQHQVQGQSNSGLTPLNPQYWEKIQQQQQAYYQQYEKNMANRMVRAKFPGRHVKFENNMKLENFFTPEMIAQASAGQMPSIDAEKAIKVEEFERKIKEVAATCASNDK